MRRGSSEGKVENGKQVSRADTEEVRGGEGVKGVEGEVT